MKCLKWMGVWTACVAMAQPGAPAPAIPLATPLATAEKAVVPASAASSNPGPAAGEASSAPPALAATVHAAAATRTAVPASAAELMRAAILKQRAAVRQQAQAAGAWLMPWSGEAAGIDIRAPCEPLADAAAAPLIEAAAKANQVGPAILRAIIEQESGFQPCAVSSKGAQGLMQLMPETAGELGVKDPFDPRESIQAGARYLKQLLDKYKGDLKLSLGAYNAGPAAVDAAGGIPDIPETRDYVDAILKKIK